MGRDAGRIAEEVIAHLSSQVDANVTITLEVTADIPSGAPAHAVRAVTKNSRTLKLAIFAHPPEKVKVGERQASTASSVPPCALPFQQVSGAS